MAFPTTTTRTTNALIPHEFIVYKNHRRGTMPIKKADYVVDGQGRDATSLGEIATELEMVQREAVDSDDEGAAEQPEEDMEDSTSTSEDEDEGAA